MPRTYSSDHENNASASQGQQQRQAEEARRRPATVQNSERNGKKTKKILLNVLLAICIIVLVVSLYFIITTLMEYQGAQSSYANLQEIAIIQSPTQSAENAAQSPTESPAGSFAPLSRSIDFDKLQAINPDIIAWLYLPGTVVDYPVVQGEDNEYYLSHTADLKKNASGAIFADYRSGLLEEQNTTLYGHNMKDDSMFHQMLSYQNQEFYEEHPCFYLYTPSHVYQLEVFSAYTTNASAHYTVSSFGSEEEYSAFLDQLIRKSNCSTDVSIATEDQIVTFSTCAYSVDDGRFAVHAKVSLLQ